MKLERSDVSQVTELDEHSLVEFRRKKQFLAEGDVIRRQSAQAGYGFPLSLLLLLIRKTLLREDSAKVPHEDEIGALEVE